jgi:hypothetical protein
MKRTLLYSLLTFITILSFSQNQKKIQKAWIKTTIENLSINETEPDTLYTRYTFDKAALFISFYPAWDDYKQEWSINGNDLTIGFDTYKIETLTDTSLTIALEGFRRIKFLSEGYLSGQDKNLITLGDFNGKPLYKANDYITPRYSKRISLRNVIQKNVEAYNIKKATYFLATFIVNEEGKVENVQIIKGITDGFNNEIIKQLMKASKDWKPAYFKGRPIQTQTVYEIKYLNSLTPFSSGGSN